MLDVSLRALDRKSSRTPSNKAEFAKAAQECWSTACGMTSQETTHPAGSFVVIELIGT